MKAWPCLALCLTGLCSRLPGDLGSSLLLPTRQWDAETQTQVGESTTTRKPLGGMCAIEKMCLLVGCLIGAGGLDSIQALLLPVLAVFMTFT